MFQKLFAGLLAIPAVLSIVVLAGQAPADEGGIRMASSGSFDPMDGAGGGYDPLAGAARGGYDPLGPRRGAPATSEGQPADLAPEFGNLPRGDGVELVYALCTACHGLDIVKQQRMTPERWAYTLDWMSAEQGMPELPEPIEARVLGYLTTHFAAGR